MKVFAWTVLIAFLAGCSNNEQVPVTKNQEISKSGIAVPSQKMAPIEPANNDTADLKALQKKYNAAKSSYAKDHSKKNEYVMATVAYATAVMNGPVPPRQKYSQSLWLYEDALKLDPKNQEAKQNRDMILSIYKQMVRTPAKRK